MTGKCPHCSYRDETIIDMGEYQCEECGKMFRHKGDSKEELNAIEIKKQLDINDRDICCAILAMCDGSRHWEQDRSTVFMVIEKHISLLSNDSKLMLKTNTRIPKVIRDDIK